MPCDTYSVDDPCATCSAWISLDAQVTAEFSPQFAAVFQQLVEVTVAGNLGAALTGKTISIFRKVKRCDVTWYPQIIQVMKKQLKNHDLILKPFETYGDLGYFTDHFKNPLLNPLRCHEMPNPRTPLGSGNSFTASRSARKLMHSGAHLVKSCGKEKIWNDFLDYLLVSNLSWLLNMAIEIVSCPINTVIFHIYV